MASDEGTPNVAFQNERYASVHGPARPYAFLTLTFVIVPLTYSKYPGQTTEFRGPGVSAENPAGAFPRDLREPHPDPPYKHQQRSTILQAIENPYALQESLGRLQVALDEIISMFEKEHATTGGEGNFTRGKEGIQLFQSWKQQIDDIKAGKI